MTTFALRIVGLAVGAPPTPFDGKLVKLYDPDAIGVDARGQPMIAKLEVTDDPKEALHFDTTWEALHLWKRQARSPFAWRSDGKPNRPLTAFTVQVERL